MQMNINENGGSPTNGRRQRPQGRLFDDFLENELYPPSR